MKLLLDENLSRRLVRALADVYSDVTHVLEVGLEMTPDTDIWEYAKRHGMTIVTKDSDFHQRSFVLGPPPKVVWIERRNCPTSVIEHILRQHRQNIERFHREPKTAYLVLA